MLIDREHAIGVTIKGSTKVSPYLAYLLLNIHHVLRLNWTGGMIGEVAIQFKIERNEFAGEMIKDFRPDQSSHTTAGVYDYFQWPDLLHVDERKRMLDIII